MHEEDLISELEHEWDLDAGFLGRLRDGYFDNAGFERLLNLLKKIDVQKTLEINRRLVSLLWYISPFLQWRLEHLSDHPVEKQTLLKACDSIHNELERILGIP